MNLYFMDSFGRLLTDFWWKQNVLFPFFIHMTDYQSTNSSLILFSLLLSAKEVMWEQRYHSGIVNRSSILSKIKNK